MNKKNRKVKKPFKGKTWDDGKTLWAETTAQDAPFSRPDWMTVPRQVCDMDGGGPKRRVLRQYLSPDPRNGMQVVTRQLEGPVYCWVNPECEQGYAFGFKPTLENPTIIDGDQDTLGLV
jgi:hypothetical protein